MLKVSARQLQGVTSFSSSTVCVLCPYRNLYENNRSKSIAHLATSGSSWSWNPIKPDQWDRNTRLHINIRSWKGRKWKQKNNKTSLFFTSHMIWSHLLHVPHLSASLVKSPFFQTVQHFYHPRLLEVYTYISIYIHTYIRQSRTWWKIFLDPSFSYKKKNSVQCSSELQVHPHKCIIRIGTNLHSVIIYIHLVYRSI